MLGKVSVLFFTCLCYLIWFPTSNSNIKNIVADDTTNCARRFGSCRTRMRGPDQAICWMTRYGTDFSRVVAAVVAKANSADRCMKKKRMAATDQTSIQSVAARLKMCDKCQKTKSQMTNDQAISYKPANTLDAFISCGHALNIKPSVRHKFQISSLHKKHTEAGLSGLPVVSYQY